MTDETITPLYDQCMSCGNSLSYRLKPGEIVVCGQCGMEHVVNADGFLRKII